jgi:hypothetical protein
MSARYIEYAALVTVAVISAIVMSVAYMGSVTTAIHVLPISIINTGDAVVAQTVNVSLNVPTLRDNFYVNSNALNMALHNGQTDVPFMPSSTADTTTGDQFYVFGGDLASGAQLNLDLYMGGATNLRPYHHMFLGDPGIVTTDDATMEPGADPWYLKVDAYLLPGIGTACSCWLVNKGIAVDLSFDALPLGELRFSLTSGDGATADSRAVSGVTTGEHMVRAIMSGDRVAIIVTGDAVLSTADTIGFNTIVDIVADWTWMISQAAYTTSLEQYKSPVLDIRLNSGDWDAGSHSGTAASGDWLALDPTATTGHWTGPLLDITSITALEDGVMAWEASQAASSASGGCTDPVCISLSYTNGPPATSSSQVFDVVTTNDPAPTSAFPTGDLTAAGMTNVQTVIWFNRDTTADASPYVKWSILTLASTADQAVKYQLNTIPLAEIEDRSPNDNPGGFSWPNLSLEPDIVSIVGAFSANIPPMDLSTTLGGGMVSTAGAMDTMFGGSTGDQLGEIYELVNFAATQGQLPIGTLWLAIGGIVVVVAGASTYIAFRNLIYAAVTMGFVILFFSLIGVGIFPFWLVIIFGIVASGIVLLIKNGVT